MIMIASATPGFATASEPPGIVTMLPPS